MALLVEAGKDLSAVGLLLQSHLETNQRNKINVFTRKIKILSARLTITHKNSNVFTFFFLNMYKFHDCYNNLYTMYNCALHNIVCYCELIHSWIYNTASIQMFGKRNVHFEHWWAQIKMSCVLCPPTPKTFHETPQLTANNSMQQNRSKLKDHKMMMQRMQTPAILSHSHCLLLQLKMQENPAEYQNVQIKFHTKKMCYIHTRDRTQCMDHANCVPTLSPPHWVISHKKRGGNVSSKVSRPTL